MKNLGKIYILFLLSVSSLYAGVSASISPRVVAIGDVVTYSLKAEGSDITEPTIYQLCGQNIISSGSRTNIEMINTEYKKTRTFLYQFVAQKDCTIEPVEMQIDGNSVKSNSVDLKVKKQLGKAEKDFILEYDISKKDVYVGESVTLTLTLKQSHSVSVVDSKFLPSDFKGFWKKSESKPQRDEDGTYLLTKVQYVLTPQREGNITISPSELRVASRVNSNGWNPTFMPQVRWKSYFSNELTLHVKPLPNNAKLIGAFTISAEADKTTTNPNEAVNVVVKVQGEGNLEDIESFKPHISGVNVFDEKIDISNNTLTQKLVFVSDHDFTIPPFELVYFDTKTKKLKKIYTKLINVKVNGSTAKQQQQTLTIKKDETAEENTEKPVVTETKNDPIALVVAFVFGVLIGISIMIFKIGKLRKSDTQKISLKDEKLLLIKLLPYKDSDSDVKEIVEILEKNIYSIEKEKLDKVKVKEVFKRYGII
ncbi:BatD family protein [Sulfurimonas sp. C5]|uniref:BatD family protein n=1 Tax=Sulfurimonas sp. C5 TaxID=3036947 RepID=UPI002455A70F|nr:BatD family protein [Sulfurimonas sp. C5]MDH4945368.1 BatD family protein [Sulfurimonas sp. C5]